MAEDNGITQVSEEQIATAETQVGAGIWGDKSIVVDTAKPAAEAVVADVKDTVVVAPANVESDTIDEDAYVKSNFEYDNADSLKQALADYKELKAKPPVASVEEPKFANDESKLIYEHLFKGDKKAVREFLETQERIENLTTAEVTADTAAEIIKLDMQLKNKNLTAKEIEFQYKQNFVASKEPVQRASETDDEFQERMDEWKESAANIEMKRVIAAKMAQPELEKLKSQIVLPNIAKPEAPVKQLTQEDLDAAKRIADGFVQDVESDLKTLNEFSVTYKDEAVQIPVSYALTADEKIKVTNQLRTFAQNNFDANTIFAERWLNADGSMNVSRMTRDLARLNSQEKIDQKLVDDAVGKRMKQYTKEKKNIKLNADGGGQNNGQFDMLKAIEETEAAIWGAKK